MKEKEVNGMFADIHETDIKETDYLLTYDTGEYAKIEDLILEYVHTTGSALCSGKHAGHGFGLVNYLFKEPCEWVIKKHIDWNNNLSHIAIPVKKSAVVHPDDEEKIAYRMMLQKILRVEKPDMETMKEHITRLLEQYKIILETND